MIQRTAILDSVTEAVYPARFRLPQHAHRAPYLCFVTKGEFTERQGRTVDTCDRTSCLFRPADDEHANEFSAAGAVCVNVDISNALLDHLRGAGLAEHRFAIRSPFIQQLRARFFDELAARDALSGLVVASLITEIMVFASRRQTESRVRGSRCVEKAQRMIEADFATPLSLTGIATVIGVHPVHLARQFRTVHGCTVGDYIRQVRVAYVRRQLATTRTPIAQIALSAGFADQSQLTRTFRRVTGRTPAAYRAESQLR